MIIYLLNLASTPLAEVTDEPVTKAAEIPVTDAPKVVDASTKPTEPVPPTKAPVPDATTKVAESEETKGKLCILRIRKKTEVLQSQISKYEFTGNLLV